MKSIVSTLLSSCLLLPASSPALQEDPAPKRPNILFIIMDDVGIDQLRVFGYGGVTPPRTPNIDAVAAGGIRFRNVWAMPECSPSRAMFFEGRYPLRTNIYAPILKTDLANSQLSPYEMTTPKVLRHAHYTSALFGKFHLAGPDNNPFKDGTPNSLGFDYFHGFLEGAPHPIDTTAGGIQTDPNQTGGLPTGPYSCGFVPNLAADRHNGADAGACYFPENRGCQYLVKNLSEPMPGRACLEKGGIFVPHAACQAALPSNVNFNLTNGYYVWNLVENDRKTNTAHSYPLTDPRARTYSPTELTTAAIDWIKSQGSQSWMATVSYSSIHAPYQQAPQALTPGEPDLGGLNCSGGLAAMRALSNQMVQAMDTEIGRLLMEAGVASRGADGSLNYNPAASNTMVIIIGDNGTYAPSVKAPFDLTRAKGYVYQTGVWVPLIVAGPLVNSPNRDDNHMVNVGDLFELFGEIAGLDVRRIVPPSHVLDSVSMLPYLTNPDQPSLRQYNFTQTANNITANNVRPGPCVIRIPEKTRNAIVNTCVQVFPQKALCEQEGGSWYGEGADPSVTTTPYASCCALQKGMPELGFDILPLAQAAVRNDEFKLVQVTSQDCSSASPSATVSTLELYSVNQAAPIPKLDNKRADLITNQANPTQGLTTEQAANFNALWQQLNEVLNSESTCPGDGNQDGIVDEKDIRNWSRFNGKGPSWYDFPVFDPVTGSLVYDGITDQQDLQVIQSNLGRKCPPR